MNAPRLAVPMVLLVLCGVPAPAVGLVDGPTPADEAGVTLIGTVRRPDGTPAPGAIVEARSEGEGERSPIIARADADGRFRIRGAFGNGAPLHARSADGEQQEVRIIPAAAVRSVSASPIDLTLAPAVVHEVDVRADGRPVEGAHVMGEGFGFEVHEVTGPDGTARLRLPARERLREISAWHPRSGIQGVRDLENVPPRGRTTLSLLPPSPLRMRVVDPDGHPVVGAELAAHFRTEGSGWATIGKIEAARVRTDGDGMAVVPWAPREDLRYVDPTLIGPDWKLDGVDLERIADRAVTIHVRRKVAVRGRLVMPAGANAEGLLVTGFGFGTRDRGDIPYARARADGSFTLRVASDHGYALGIDDLEWAADPWSGLILGQSAGKPAEIAMSVYRATPVTIRVTRGPNRIPVAGAWLDVGIKARVEWVDSGGKKRTGGAGIGSWLRTDDHGLARAGAARGQFEVRLASGNWDENRTLSISAATPVEVAFYRAWSGDRRIAGRLLSDGKPFQPSPTMAARAWSRRPPYLPYQFNPEVKPDGSFSVAFDAEDISLFFSDPAKRRDGFAQFDRDESSVALNLVAMGRYAGTLLDEEGHAMPGQTLTLSLKDAGPEPIAAQQTDGSGRFRFDAVPAAVPLRLQFGGLDSRPEYYISGGDRLFEPGEARDGDEVRAHRRQSPGQVASRPVALAPLADRIDVALRSVHDGGMNVLLILPGDESREVTALVVRLLDDDRSPLILRYLPVRGEPGDVKAVAATLARRGWPVPAPGQVVLVALDGDGWTIASKAIAARAPGAAGLGDEFLKQHGPAPRDARARLAAARDEARRTGRRVWVVLGGPRCGPCFRLGRWIDEHRATLDKDYVFVKVLGGLDEHSSEVFESMPMKPGDGIPWYAITEPDGTILITSRGPLGNLGFPTTVEDLRHLRRMIEGTARKLTADEVDGLIGSLATRR